MISWLLALLTSLQVPYELLALVFQINNGSSNSVASCGLILFNAL